MFKTYVLKLESGQVNNRSTIQCEWNILHQWVVSNYNECLKFAFYNKSLHMKMNSKL